MGLGRIPIPHDPRACSLCTVQLYFFSLHTKINDATGVGLTRFCYRNVYNIIYIVCVCVHNRDIKHLGTKCARGFGAGRARRFFRGVHTALLFTRNACNVNDAVRRANPSLEKKEIWGRRFSSFPKNV